MAKGKKELSYSEERELFYKDNKNFIEFFKPLQAIDIKDVMREFNLTNREVRRKISKMATYFAVVSLSDSKGYIRLGTYDNLDSNEIENIIELVEHQKKDYESRIAILNARLRPLYAWVESAKK